MTRLAAIDIALARKVLQTEADAILALIDRLDGRFEQAVQILLDCRGRVLVTGMGKSGIICRKLAATLSSTGTPAFFLHPAEAVHGDLGALQSDDVILALSNSGETEELLRLLETIKRLGARMIAMTGDCASTLGQAADVALDCHVSEEACPMNLVPTASTTASLALGDALAMTLFVAKGFRQEDFANIHPGGRLGKRLMRVEQLMHVDAPIVQLQASMPDVMQAMSRTAPGRLRSFGMTCVVGGDGRLAGVITDGDLRRLLMSAQQSGSGSVLDRTAADVMSRSPVTVSRAMLAVEALRLMEEKKITSVVVVGHAQQVEGVLHVHDLWRTQLF
ncbi:MAG TPA: KpsF/GutQ family sugar-phosphate isomerase [Vicinamibacterales bacterium]|nr:KpsF/GutQ family sugar-phosphate isomerase [Vicinamibacterales bacterium]